MEKLEFLQDNTLQHTILGVILYVKVGQQQSETATHPYLINDI